MKYRILYWSLSQDSR